MGIDFSHNIVYNKVKLRRKEDGLMKKVNKNQRRFNFAIDVILGVYGYGFRGKQASRSRQI